MTTIAASKESNEESRGISFSIEDMAAESNPVCTGYDSGQRTYKDIPSKWIWLPVARAAGGTLCTRGADTYHDSVFPVAPLVKPSTFTLVLRLPIW
jgi:hypothetical protein